jgi:hypothetical protein
MNQFIQPIVNMLVNAELKNKLSQRDPSVLDDIGPRPMSRRIRQDEPSAAALGDHPGRVASGTGETLAPRPVAYSAQQPTRESVELGPRPIRESLQPMGDVDSLPLRPRDDSSMMQAAGDRVHELAPRDPTPVRLDRMSPSHRRMTLNARNHPTREEYVNEHRPQGFGQRVWSGVKTFGKGLVASGGNPLLAAMGAIASGFDPDAEAKLTYNAFVNPRHLTEQKYLREAAKDEIGMTNTLEDNDLLRDRLDQTGLIASERERRLRSEFDERNAQAWERIDQTDRRLTSAERRAEIKDIIASARIPGRKLSAEAKAKLAGYGITLPDDFDPMKHDLVETSEGFRIVSISQATGQPTVTDVPGKDGKLLQPAPKSSSTPSFVYRGRAEAELLREHGFGRATDMVSNPVFEELFKQAKADEQSAAQRFGRPAASDDEIRRYVRSNNPSVKEKIRAGEVIKGQVNQRASEIWEREKGKGTSGAARPASPTSGASKASQDAARSSAKTKLDAAIKLIDESGLTPEKKDAAKKELQEAHERRWGK